MTQVQNKRSGNTGEMTGETGTHYTVLVNGKKINWIKTNCILLQTAESTPDGSLMVDAHARTNRNASGAGMVHRKYTLKRHLDPVYVRRSLNGAIHRSTFGRLGIMLMTRNARLPEYLDLYQHKISDGGAFLECDTEGLSDNNELSLYIRGDGSEYEAFIPLSELAGAPEISWEEDPRLLWRPSPCGKGDSHAHVPTPEPETTALPVLQGTPVDIPAGGWFCAAPAESPASLPANDLVIRDQQGRPATTSLLVAEKFDKRHDTVLRAIRNLEFSPDFNHRNFAAVEYEDAKGEKRPMYMMTRNGFFSVAMGFTGRPAALWKERFIGAFDAMETALASGRGIHSGVDVRLARMEKSLISLEQNLARAGRLISLISGANPGAGAESLFIRKCCVLGPDFRVLKNDLYAAYRNFCRASGFQPVSHNIFFRKLYSIAIYLKTASVTENGKRQQAVRGLSLRTALEGKGYERHAGKNGDHEPETGTRPAGLEIG